MKRTNKIAFIVVLLLVVLFGVGQFFAGTAPTSQQPTSGSQPPDALNGQPPQPTQVLAYEPPVLASGPQTQQGSCWTNSIAAPYRKDAWRCAVGNGISDPCFQIPNNVNLICGVNPMTPGSEFILQLTKPLPAPEVPPGAAPVNWGWLVQLQDGTLCSPFTGTRPFAAGGQVAAYGCAPGPLGNDIMIFGDLNSSSSVWTATIGTLQMSSSTKQPPSIAGERVANVRSVWQ